MAFKGVDGSITDNYFLANSAKLTKCEDTLPDYGLEEAEFNRIADENHYKEKTNLIDHYKITLFPKIYALMLNGYNVVLHGFGSKRVLIDEFISVYLGNFIVIVFYGYKDEMNQRQILTAFREALDCDKMDEDVILERIGKSEKRIFLIIHSFDRFSVRNNKIKPLLNKIIYRSPEKVHLLTSIDHINSSLTLTCRDLDCLNLVWIKCPTFADYQMEKSFAHLSTSRSSGSSKHRSAAATLVAVSSVYDNLPDNSQKIFLLILNYFHTHLISEEQDKASARQRNRKCKNNETESDTDTEDEEPDRSGHKGDNKTGKGFEGYPYNRLYNDCLDAFFVNSDKTLRAQLVEFVDHKLIKYKIGADGSEFIELLIPHKLIPKVLQELGGPKPSEN